MHILPPHGKKRNLGFWSGLCTLRRLFQCPLKKPLDSLWHISVKCVVADLIDNILMKFRPNADAERIPGVLFGTPQNPLNFCAARVAARHCLKEYGHALMLFLCSHRGVSKGNGTALPSSGSTSAALAVWP